MRAGAQREVGRESSRCAQRWVCWGPGTAWLGRAWLERARPAKVREGAGTGGDDKQVGGITTPGSHIRGPKQFLFAL